MPLPLLLGLGAAAAAVIGGKAIYDNLKRDDYDDDDYIPPRDDKKERYNKLLDEYVKNLSSKYNIELELVDDENNYGFLLAVSSKIHNYGFKLIKLKKCEELDNMEKYINKLSKDIFILERLRSEFKKIAKEG